MSKREQEKKTSLDALARVAYAVGGGNPHPAPPPKPKAKAPQPRPQPQPQPRPLAKPAEPALDRARRAQLADRKAKLEEERALRERRERELAGGSNLAWRGAWTAGNLPGVHRTAFDRVEPSLADKIHGVLGDAKEKDGRAKNRDKGRRQGGR
ncbi:MAG: hypothetical protein QOE90_436 [Thermoplasmata archaeon]|nr:hypothetical protein [Thermoplasmata archaeon]